MRRGTKKAQSQGWPAAKYHSEHSEHKAATNTVTAILARERRVLTVNCHCPGWFGSDSRGVIDLKPSKVRKVGAKIPVRRSEDPSKIYR